MRSCRYAVVLTLGVAALLLGGCATTRPWEREIQAKRIMSPEDDADLAALQEHYFGTREGAVGALGGGGGGCGCN